MYIQDQHWKGKIALDTSGTNPTNIDFFIFFNLMEIK